MCGRPSQEGKDTHGQPGVLGRPLHADRRALYRPRLQTWTLKSLQGTVPSKKVFQTREPLFKRGNLTA